MAEGQPSLDHAPDDSSPRPHPSAPEDGRAWRLKEALRDLFRQAENREQADAMFSSWWSWARRSCLAPFERFEDTLRRHREGLLNAFDSRLSNGRVEGINSLIQAAKARARGHRTTHSLATIAYLIAGKLGHLPASPYTQVRAKTASQGPARVTHTDRERAKKMRLLLLEDTNFRLKERRKRLVALR